MSKENGNLTQNLALIYGSLLARVWLGVRAVQTGVEKYSGIKLSEQPVNIDGSPNTYGLTADTPIKEYGFSHYHGVPEALYKKFEGEPLMMGFGLKIYDFVLGPALILLGLAILFGFAYRSSLLLLGLLYISLTWGLILISQDAGVSWLGVHMILIVMALMLAEHNRFSVPMLKKW